MDELGVILHCHSTLVTIDNIFRQADIVLTQLGRHHSVPRPKLLSSHRFGTAQIKMIDFATGERILSKASFTKIDDFFVKNQAKLADYFC